MKKSLPSILAAASILALSVLPASAQKYYLFAGDRAPNPGRSASLHRYIYDAQAGTLTPAPGPGQAGALWGGAGSTADKGLDYSGVAMAADGDIYAVSSSARKVVRLDGKTGNYKSVVMSNLTAPDGLAVGPDGNIYVADGKAILRTTPTGQPRPGAEQIGNVFTRGGDINTVSGLTFGPDGNLYAANQNWRRISRFDGKTGEFLGNLNVGDVNTPGAIAFGPDGNLYVACISGQTFKEGTGYVIKLDGKTGQLLGKFAPDAEGAMGLAFVPNGNLFVSNYWKGSLAQFDGKTGKPVGETIHNTTGGAFNNLILAIAGADSDAPNKPYQR